MNQPPGSALPLDSFLFPPGSYVLDGRYKVECLIGQNRETGSHVYRAVAVDAVPDLKLAAGDRVVVKVMPSADTGMARAEYGFLRQAVDNWRDASVAQPVEVSSGGTVVKHFQFRTQPEISKHFSGLTAGRGCTVRTDLAVGLAGAPETESAAA